MTTKTELNTEIAAKVAEYTDAMLEKAISAVSAIPFGQMADGTRTLYCELMIAAAHRYKAGNMAFSPDRLRELAS